MEKFICSLCGELLNYGVDPFRSIAYLDQRSGRQMLMVCSKCKIDTNRFACYLCGKKGKDEFKVSVDFVNANFQTQHIICSSKCKEKHIQFINEHPEFKIKL